ncbi:MAG TPA: ABC transporter substrate-binding protein [Sporichthya sp.]|nr:ABC transporter substrate-binding protein [Sporichthya sp.]
MSRSRLAIAATSMSMSIVLLTACGGSGSQRDALDAQQAPDAAAPAAADATGNAAAVPGEVPAAGAAPGAAPGEVPGAATAPDAGKAKGKGAKTDVTTDATKPGGAGGAAAAGGTLGPSDVGITASTIKVGHIGIYSGPVGSFGDDLSQACRAGLQSINDSGGLSGRKLDVVVRDDGWDATKGSNAVRDLVEREKVWALACSMSVPTNDAVTPYLDQQKVPNIGSDGWGEAQYAGAWSFPVGASGVNEGENLAEYQYKVQGLRTVGIIHFNNTTGEAYRDAYKKVFEELGGKVLVTQAANFDDPGTTTFIAQCRAKNVDGITAMIDPGIFARMVREAAAQAYKPRLGYSGGAALYFQVTPQFTGPTAEGTIATVDWVPDDPNGPAKNATGFRAYKETVEKYYPKIDHSNWTKAGYVGSKLLQTVAKKLGVNLTRQGMKDELDKVTGFDTGLGPKLTFRPGAHRANKTTYLVQLQKSGNQLMWRYIAGPIVNPRRGNS